MTKILLCGSDRNNIDHFLNHSEGDVRYFSTSINTNDLHTHIELISPDKILLCAMDHDVVGNRTFLENLSKEAEVNRIPIFIVTEKEQFGPLREIISANVIAKAIDHTFTDFGQIEQTVLAYEGTVAEHSNSESVPQQAEPAPIPSITDVSTSLENDPEIRALTGEDKPADEGVEELEKVDRNDRLHVLIIDDSPVMLKTLKTYLEDSFDVAVALSGELALNFLSKKSTDVILLDYEMPNMTGPDVLFALRQNPRTRNTPVIFLTGVSDKNKIRQVLAMKPQGYLLKPIPKDKLTEAIRHVVFGDD